MGVWIGWRYRIAFLSGSEFLGRLAFFDSFCWKPPMPITFRVLGGGVRFFFWKGPPGEKYYGN